MDIYEMFLFEWRHSMDALFPVTVVIKTWGQCSSDVNEKLTFIDKRIALNQVMRYIVEPVVCSNLADREQKRQFCSQGPVCLRHQHHYHSQHFVRVVTDRSNLSFLLARPLAELHCNRGLPHAVRSRRT